MNIVFFGTSIFAVPSLKALAGSSHKVLLVVTQPDRKKGRYLKLTPSPIKDIAIGLDTPVYQPVNASASEPINYLKRLSADLFVVVSFGQLLSEELLKIPGKFAINLHGSVLPKYRGAAPINWAVINGEKKTGVTVFRLEKRMDAGDIILKEEVDIEDSDNAVTLSERLSQAGAGVLIQAVDLIDKGKESFNKQDERLVSFAPKLKKPDGLINWGLSAIELHNRVRGLLPWPSAFTSLKGKIIKVLEADALPDEAKEAACGQITGIKEGLGILVKTKKGCLVIKRLQLEGSRPMGFEEFLRGHRLKTGDLLGTI